MAECKNIGPEYPSRSTLDAVREIDNDSWLIDGKIILSRVPLAESMWPDGKGAGFKVSDAPSPPPASRKLSETSEIRPVYEPAYDAAAWYVGQAFLKIRAYHQSSKTTREHATLEWLHKRTWSFHMPKVIYHAEHEERYYIITTRVPGEPIEAIWPTLDATKKLRHVKRLAAICNELAIPADEGQVIRGVDGSFLHDTYICGVCNDYSPPIFLKSCETLGMDCSKLVFYHGDMKLSSTFVSDEPDNISIIDWGHAGFVPMEWVQTKIMAAVGGKHVANKVDEEWRGDLLTQLSNVGFRNVLDNFVKWRREEHGDIMAPRKTHKTAGTRATGRWEWYYHPQKSS